MQSVHLTGTVFVILIAGLTVWWFATKVAPKVAPLILLAVLVAAAWEAGVFQAVVHHASTYR